MQKKARQNQLLEIISSRPVGSQADLTAVLGVRGFVVTQASVSRDLDELGIVKVDGRYVRPPNFENERDSGAVIFTSAGDNLIVGRCSPGLASAITVRIDQSVISGIVGTIAGDDTIFIAIKDSGTQRMVLERLMEMFG